MEIHDVKIVPEGDGVNVKRLFPLHDFMNFDPFVLFDHFDIGADCGFPDHPHRGFEAITYMFEGGMNHKDNMGNNSFVTVGGAQRFTAGSGMVHSEMPAEHGKSIGIQLWINLPERLKKINPDYQQVDSTEFPIEKFEGGQAKIIVGIDSPLKLNTNVIYQHVLFNSKSSYSIKLETGMRGLVYVLSGNVKINKSVIRQDQALFIKDADLLEISADTKSELMVCIGMPHGEPIRQHGPFVD